MVEKSHVGMAYHVCPVCLEEHDPLVLLDRRLRKTLTDKEFAGWALCPAHEKLRQDGYVALVEVTNQKAPQKLADAERTGRVAHVRVSAWPKLFNMPLPDGGLAFVDPAALDQIRQLVPAADDETPETPAGPAEIAAP